MESSATSAPAWNSLCTEHPPKPTFQTKVPLPTPPWCFSHYPEPDLCLSDPQLLPLSQYFHRGGMKGPMQVSKMQALRTAWTICPCKWRPP